MHHLPNIDPTVKATGMSEVDWYVKCPWHLHGANDIEKWNEMILVFSPSIKVCMVGG